MESIDKTENLCDLMIDIEAALVKNKQNKQLLIRESFVLWYILIEGHTCENFTAEEINKLLKKNYAVFKSNFLDDSDYCFMIGWMIEVSFWYFDESIDEKYGSRLLLKAYKSNTKNYLFKWAARAEIGLSSNEVQNLRTQISLRFDEFYNYGPLIKDYFLRLN